MPVSVVCESSVNDVNAALRESLGNSYSTLEDSKPGTSSTATKKGNGAENIHNKLVATTKRVLISALDYEEINNYSENVLDPLKTKYAVLSKGADNGNMDNGNTSSPIRIKSAKNGLSGGATDQKKLQHLNSNNDGNLNSSNYYNSKHNTSPNELPKPKRILFQREDVRIGWKNGTHMWQIGVGMLNVGNTCYLNSTLQALFHVPSMANWLLSDTKHQAECNTDDMNCIICAMAKTLQESQNNQSAIRPYRVYSKLKLICKHLVMGRQEDAHEFMRYLVEAMEKSYLSRFRNNKELDQYSKETTPLNQILGGYLKTAVRCLACGHVSVTFQHFQDLLLDIRKADTIEEALEGYFSRERLEDMGYKCESCKKKVSATKQFSLERAPIALCIQLKRFSMLGTKIHKHITLKPRLDLSKFVSRNTTGEQLTYKLVSMVTHLGASQHGGHYTAIGLTESGVYYNYDDSYVRPINVQTVCNTNAYIILYEIDNVQPRQVSSTQTTSEETKDIYKRTNGYTSNNTQRIVGPQLPPSGLNNCSTIASSIKTSLGNSYIFTNGNKLGNRKSNGISSNNISSKLMIHFNNSNSYVKSSGTSSSKTCLISTTGNKNNGISNYNSQVQNGGHIGTWNSQETLHEKPKTSSTITKEEIAPILNSHDSSSSFSSDNENDVSSSSHLENKKPNSKPLLPSMPKLVDKSKYYMTSQYNGGTKKTLPSTTISKTSFKSLVPYESESDEEEVPDQMCFNTSITDERYEKNTIKRYNSSPLTSNNSYGRSDCDYKDSKPTSEAKVKKTTPSTTSNLMPNLININKTHTSQSKIKKKTDTIDEIFKFNIQNLSIINNGTTTSANKNKQTTINHSTIKSDKEEHTTYEDNAHSTFKRSESTPPSPPVIKTKTGFWQVTSLNSTSAIISPTEQKAIKNPNNPFATKAAVLAQAKKPKISVNRSSKLLNFTANGYVPEIASDSAIDELLLQSHRGYGVPVLTWNGDKTTIEKEINNEVRDRRQRDWEEEEENDIDRGRQKKTKINKQVHENDLARGPNPFQEQENQRRWRLHTHSFHRGHFRRQFHRSKLKFQRFNHKKQRAHQRGHSNSSHRRRDS